MGRSIKADGELFFKFFKLGNKLPCGEGKIWEYAPPPAIIVQKNKILSFLFTTQGCLYVNLRRYRLYGLRYPLIK